MPITPEDRLALYGITAQVRAALRSAAGVLLPQLDAVLVDFYAHVAATPGLLARFPDQATMDRARDAQKAHWRRLLSASFDADFFEGADRIGRVHHRIGLDPATYVSTYALVETRLQRMILSATHRGLGRYRINDALVMLDAVTRAKNLDIEVTIAAMMTAQHQDFEARLARLATAFQSQIGGVSTTVGTAAQQLSATAEGMQGNTRSAMSRSDSAVSSIGNAASGLMSVSAAADELRASIHSINDQVKEASRIAGSGAQKALETDALVQVLKTSADEINGVVELISDVASQTNLLALNASVEAARAGEAGKGFAVVAGEVKQLSLRISEATDDISRKINQMHNDTTQAVAAIRSITGTIQKLAEISAAIAISVEEQRLATDEIANNATSSASETELLTQNIEAVGSVIRAANSTSDEVIAAARQLTQQSHVLNSEVARFLSGFRAA